MAFDLDSVQKDIRKLRSFLKSKPKHATPEQIHSLRTTLRRFETAMQALALDSDANERPLIRGLAKLRRRAGKVRDLDVLTGYAAELQISGEKECLIQLLEHLGADHAHRNQRLHSFVVKRGDWLRRRLNQTAFRLKASSQDAAAGQNTPGDAMRSELRLQRELTEPARLTKSTLHPYRLQVRGLRYMLQMEQDPADRELIESLGQVKDAIGEWHDWQHLLTIARDHLPHGSKCKLIALLQQTTQQKLKQALAVAETGRRHIQPSQVGIMNTI